MKSNSDGIFNGRGALYFMLIATLTSIIYAHSTAVGQRYKLIENFFIAEGVSPEFYMQAIDLNRSVRFHTIKKGDIVIQYQTPNSPQGNFYGLPNTEATELGISEHGLDPKTGEVVKKEIRYYKAIKDVDTLASYAKPTRDTWSVPGKETKTSGYKIQLFTSCKDCFIRIE